MGELRPPAVPRADVVLELAAVALLHADEGDALARRVDLDLGDLGEVFSNLVDILVRGSAERVPVELHVERGILGWPFLAARVPRVEETLAVGKPGEAAAAGTVLDVWDHLEDFLAGG